MMVCPPADSSAAPMPVRMEFAGGQVMCQILPSGTAVPDLLQTVLPVAMRTALDEIGPPPQPAVLTIRLQKPPPFYKRALLLVPSDVLATQEGDEIRLQPGRDPLKLAFRLGHELSHWLLVKRHPARPPLWLDEGLANHLGAAAAEAAARPLGQTVERPVPDRLKPHLQPLDDLVARRVYPRPPAEVGAFYWQAETLVTALRDKLGRDAFREYLGLMAVPEPPGWEAPLRERWYFNDADFRWLADRIAQAP